MKKLAIYTIQSENYGNRLQNYAVQLVCEKNGYCAISLNARDPFRTTSSLARLPGIYGILKKGRRILKCFLKNDSSSNFLRFNKKIRYSSDYISADSYRVGKYYALLVGSDQVWNTTFSWISSNAFIPFPHSRKIAFSASFGVDSISYDQTIADCVNDFKALSVREEAGAQIIKELTGRDAVVLVDPTMLLTKEDWRKVAKKPKGAKEGYILTYFLSPKCHEAKAQLDAIKGSREVYELLDPDDKVAGKAGPSEFLWLFDHADVILTDSFHACVFSFLFNKPFLVYDRNWDEGNMNSRLDTLLKKFSLERKYVNSGMDNNLWEHDYTEGYRQLELERKKAMDFLKQALED